MAIDIIPENRKRTAGENFASAFGGLAQLGGQYMQRKAAQEQAQKRNAQLSQLLGYDVSELPENMQMEALKNKFASQLQGEKFENEAQKKALELQGKMEPLQGAMDVLNRMKDLRKTGKLGIGSTIWPDSDVRKAAGEYEQLGKSLIQYATNIPIRNKLEFETLAEQLYDPTITDAKAEGVLNAMERIIRNSMESLGGSFESVFQGKSNQEKRPPLTAFQR